MAAFRVWGTGALSWARGSQLGNLVLLTLIGAIIMVGIRTNDGIANQIPSNGESTAGTSGRETQDLVYKNGIYNYKGQFQAGKKHGEWKDFSL